MQSAMLQASHTDSQRKRKYEEYLEARTEAIEALVELKSAATGGLMTCEQWNPVLPH